MIGTDEAGFNIAVVNCNIAFAPCILWEKVLSSNMLAFVTKAGLSCYCTLNHK